MEGWLKVHRVGRDDDSIERMSLRAKYAWRERNKRARRSSKGNAVVRGRSQKAAHGLQHSRIAKDSQVFEDSEEPAFRCRV